MQKRALKVAILAALTIILVFGMSAAALGFTYTDVSGSTVGPYKIGLDKVSEIADVQGGAFRPYDPVERGEFAVMAVNAFDIPLVNPATPTFKDVPATHPLYQYIEAAAAAGIIQGYTDGNFGPNDTATRQQLISIIARYVGGKAGYYVNGTWNFRTPAEIDKLVAHFGDAASIDPAHKTAIAFAYAMGITIGDQYGNLNPLAKVTRIQALAMLARSQGLVPWSESYPTTIVQVSADKAENLIGKPHTLTFKVTDKDGHPAKGALVDFDTLFADPYYVGNISPQAALTDAFGEVKVNLLSAEPGTQRVSATIQTITGPATAMATKYWVALDEVYAIGSTTARNNAGDPHEWSVRVIVFGPGPRSTAQTDWYNFIDASFDPNNLQANDGIDGGCLIYGENAPDYLTYDDELALAGMGFAPRTMAGIDVLWSIYDLVDDPATRLTDETYTSVGNITAVDGVALPAPARTATGKTNDAGLSKITIESTVTGLTYVSVVATYPENPYPKMLLNHLAVEADDWDHYIDWHAQNLSLVKTWIPHNPAAVDGPISGAGTANIGEEKTMVLTLVDSFGNPVPGASVEWFMQGVGWFETDNDGAYTDKTSAAGNKDFDVTDAAGKAEVFIKSHTAGEQIVHAKVRGKGVDGAEGVWTTYTAEMQWYDVDVATFDNPLTIGEWVEYADGDVYEANNEALSSNPVGESHTFDMWVYGLKLEYTPEAYYPDAQTPWIDGDVPGAAYDGIIDARDAAYFGGILLVNDGVFGLDENENGIIDPEEAGETTVVVGGKTLTLSLVGGITEFDWNQDGYKEPFTGRTGIYMPLEGKTVTFTRANETGPNLSNLGSFFDSSDTPAVGSFTPATAVTDADGKVSVTVTSAIKGPETIKGTVDWDGNPHNGPELVSAYAKKAWVAGIAAPAGDLTIDIYIDGKLVRSSKPGARDIVDSIGPMVAWRIDPDTGELVADLESVNVEVHVRDAAGNDLPDYQVEYLLDHDEGLRSSAQAPQSTFLPWAYLTDLDTLNVIDGVAYDTNGTRPDSNEPHPDSDPYAYIVGEQETESFFFNRWLGVGPNLAYTVEQGYPGLREWYTPRIAKDFYEYWTDPLTAAKHYYDSNFVWSYDADELFDGFDGVYDGVYDGFFYWDEFDEEWVLFEDICLATDGAKAWTLDGGMVETEDGVVANKLEGSNIDIQLADTWPLQLMEEWGYPVGVHFKNILRVMVYAPGDGPAMGETPIYSAQVHHVWEIPVPTTIDISPAADVNRWADGDIEHHQVTATVRDQFGNPMPDVEVQFQGQPTEGGNPYDVMSPTSEWFDYPNPAITDDNGQATVSSEDNPPEAWSNWRIRAVVEVGGELLSSPVVTKYWAPEHEMYVSADGRTLYIAGELFGNDNKQFNVYKNAPNGKLLATGVYDADLDYTIIQLSDQVVIGTDYIWVNFPNASLTDDWPNWIWALATELPTPPIP
jgi:hypothetical protein